MYVFIMYVPVHFVECSRPPVPNIKQGLTAATDRDEKSMHRLY